MGAAWNDTQCANVGIEDNVGLVECQAACLRTAGCTAINFAEDSAGGCVLRACSSPVPQPQANAGWRAYAYNGTAASLGQVWHRPLANGDWAVAAHNPTEEALDIAVNLTHWFAPVTRVRCRDLFRRAELGVFAGLVKAKAVAPHGVTMLRLSLDV